MSFKGELRTLGGGSPTSSPNGKSKILDVKSWENSWIEGIKWFELIIYLNRVKKLIELRNEIKYKWLIIFKY